MTTTTTLDPAYKPPILPAEVDDSYRYASVAQRLGSSIADCMVTAVLCIPVFRAEGLSRGAAFGWMAVLWIAWYLYAYISYRRWGQTLGKWIFRTRLVSASDHGPVSGRQILVRVSAFAAFALLLLPGYWTALGRFHAGSYGDVGWLQRQTLIEDLTPGWGDVVLGCYWVFLGACVISILISSRKQSLHDMVAGTVVVSLHAREPVTYAPPVSRGHRALAIADWTLATLLGLIAAFFVLAALGAKLDTNPATSADLNAAVKPMLYVAVVSAVLAALMANAALSLRAGSTLRRRGAHVIAYLLTFLPIALLLLGLLAGY